MGARLLTPSARASRLEDLRALLAKMREACSLLDPLVRELEFLYVEACNAVNDLGRLDPERERLMLSAGDAAFAVRAWLDQLMKLLDALEA